MKNWKENMKNIVITGVSTGIGLATAKRLLNNGYRVFGSVRKETDANQLQQEWGDKFVSLIFDVRDTEVIYKAVEKVSHICGEEGLDALINNSGIAIGGPIKYIDTDLFRKQFEVNLFGVINVTKAFLQLLGAEKNNPHAGKIIMISSVAGKRAYPFMGPYSASKHALEGMSDSLRRELLLYGIDVILIEPGPIKTEIWGKSPDRNDNPFTGTEYEPALKKFYDQVIQSGYEGLDADVVANRIQKVIESSHPKTRYVITGDKLKKWIIPNYLPDRWVDKIFGKALGLIK